MTIATAKNTPRNTYTASAGQTNFTIGFEFFKVADVKVFKNGTLLTYHADPTTYADRYKIVGATSTSDEAYEFGSGGTVVLGSTGASANDKIVIIRDITIERTQDFPLVGAFDITSLNTQLDTLTSMMAEQDTLNSRSIRLADTDVDSATMTLPDKATRASKMLEFDSNGNVATNISSTGLQTVADNVASVIAVAGQITPTNNIGTLAGISSNISTVAGISSNVTTVANANSNIGVVTTNIASINTNASNITAIQNASTNATNAANSATAAQQAQAAAELAADNFGDLYLGAKSSDPTVDNDGDALTTGDLFFHSGTNNLRVYNGSAWEDAAISTNGFATTGLSIAMSVAL
tara:strand:- start:1021 stop:2073 length:1053 start_codon:yes stop_codon:yes gene_type:complete